MYRDELTKASQRLDELQAKLDSQNEELEELRRQLAKRIELASSPSRSRRRVLVIGSALAAAFSALVGWAVTSAGPPTKKPASMLVASVARSAAAAVSAPPAEGGPAPAGEGSEGSSVNHAEKADRVAELSSRCKRPVPGASLDGLPAGTRVLDFKLCAGCDCCLPGGAFPPLFDEHHKPIDQTGACIACARDWSLADAGITVIGGSPGDPLDGTHGLIFNLARPAAVFALHIAGSGYRITPQPMPDHVASLIAYDENGRPIDAARTTYTSAIRHSAGTDFAALERVLLVQACEGEKIGRVDLETEDMNLRIKAIAAKPARGR